MAFFTSRAKNEGFDPSSSGTPRPWKAVFKDETTEVRLVGGKKHRFRVEPMASPDVIWADKPPAADGSRIVRLNGNNTGGHVTLIAFDPTSSGSEARLDLDVLERSTKQVRFYRLIDSAGHQPTRTLASMRQVLFDAAVIHSLQDGVFLTMQGAQDVILDVDLGRIPGRPVGGRESGQCSGVADRRKARHPRAVFRPETVQAAPLAIWPRSR